MPNNNNQLLDNDPTMQAIRRRAMLHNVGQDTAAADMMTSPDRTLQMQAYEAVPPSPMSGSEIDSMRWLQYTQNSLREDGLESLADAATVEGSRPFVDRAPGLANEGAMRVREGWRELRTDLSIDAVQQANDGTNFFVRTLGRALGSDAGQIVMGGVEPLARAQQAVYGLLKGEGFAAFSRIFPSVVLEDQFDEEGNVLELSPFSAAIDAAWSKMRGDDLEFAQDMENLRRVNMEYMEADLLEFSDVVDSAYGEGAMDEFYADLYDAGPLGKLAMGALSAGYAVAEVVIDPLLVFDFLPTKAVQGVKGLASTATQASLAAKTAQRTRRIADMADSVNAAAKHLDKAHAVHKAAPTESTAINLRNAMKLYAERVDKLNGRIRPEGNGFDAINMSGPGKRNPHTIPTTSVETSSGVLRAGTSSWERGLAEDLRNGLGVRTENVNDPARPIRSGPYTNVVSKIGDEVTAADILAPEAYAIAEMVGESLGLRVVPIVSEGALVMDGLYSGGSRTLYINVANTQTNMLDTIMHESWHHIFRTFFSNPEQADVVRKMISAGWDFEGYKAKARDLLYYFPDEASAANEFTARALSDFASNPEFWKTLAKIDPKAFGEFGDMAIEMARKAESAVDLWGGKRPHEWFGLADGSLEDPKWGQYYQDVMSAMSSAWKEAPNLEIAEMARVTSKLDTVIQTLHKERDALRAVGKDKTPMLDREITRAERYRIRLDEDGPAALVKGFKYEHETLRQLDTDEVRAIVDLERRLAATRSTHEVQPRPREWHQGDLFEGEMADRVALGPDDAEHAAEGLGRMVHNASEDDVTMRLTALPERQAETGGRIVPGTSLGMIDQDQLNRTLWDLKQRAKAGQMELWEYDSGAAMLDEALKQSKGKDVPYDDAWLPKPRKKTEDLVTEGWYDEYGSNFFDRMAKGVTPHSWQIKTPSLLRAGMMFMREPMRVLEAVDPGKSWPLLRGAMHNMENETTRLKTVFHDALSRFGALEVTEPSTLRKAVMTGAKQKERVHEKMSELLFDILDTPTNSEQYVKLMDGLSSQQRQAVADIRHELNLVADRLGISTTDKFIDGYIHHAFDPGLFSKGGMPPEMAGLSRNGQLFIGFLMDRNGNKGFVKDAVAALDVYSRGAGRKIHLEPALERFRERAIWHAKMDQRNKFFLKYADMTIAQLRGEPSLLGSLVDNTVGAIASAAGIKYKPGSASRKLMGMSSLIYSSLLAGNRRYPIMSIATALATTGAQFGMFRTAKALFKMATPEGQLIFKSVGGDDLWARVFEGDLMATFTRDMSKIRLGGPSIQDTENFIRGMTFWAAIDESLTKLGHKSIQMADESGILSEVLFDALRTTEEVNHFFGVGSKPPIFSRISKTGSVVATQFLSFPFKQAEQLIAMTADNPGKIFAYMGLSGWLSRVAAQDLGVDLKDYVGLQAVKMSPSNMQSPGVGLLAAAARMMGHMSSLMDGHGSSVEAKQAVDDFLKESEVMVPLLRLGREAAQAAEITSTGRLTVPGLGYGRDVDLQTVNVGGMELPIPTGPKGDRSEAVGLVSGARTVEETLQQGARKRVRQAVNEAAIERLALVEEAKKAASRNDFAGMQKQLQRMQQKGFPIGDFSNAIKAKEEIQRLDWYMTEIKNNPSLAHKLIPIMQEYGIIKTDKEQPGVQDQ